jgi:diaminopimelate epimerase
MEFAKLQGTGNDFVLVDARGMERDWPALARSICHRRLGVGADGLLLLLTSETAALRLRMFNPDGSEAEACGNGLRCFARYASERGLVDGAEFGVETMAGTRAVRVLGDGSVRAEMGVPRFASADIPVNVQGGPASDESPVSDHPVRAAGRELRISCVSMGNPHAVCFLEQSIDEFPLDEVGPDLEHHAMFPNRVNFEIVNVVSRRRLRARVWERGAGETLSCGSGVCAVAVVSLQKGLCDSPVDVEVPGGMLSVGWDGEGEVLLTGPAETVFVGKWES